MEMLTPLVTIRALLIAWWESRFDLRGGGESQRPFQVQISYYSVSVNPVLFLS